MLIGPSTLLFSLPSFFTGALLLGILLAEMAVLITTQKQEHAKWEAEPIFIILAAVWETCHCGTIYRKLENYQIIVVKKRITAPSIGCA